MTSQQEAQQMLDRWQELKGLPPEDRMEILMEDFFKPVSPCDVEYEAMVRRISEEMYDV